MSVIDDARKRAEAGGAKPEAEDEKKKPAAADLLTEIGLRCDLFHDAAGKAYAALGRRTMPVRNKLFRLHLTNVYRHETGKVPNGEAMATAISAVEAAAVYDGPARAAHLRIAYHNGRVYLYMGDDDDTVIEIDAGGWRVCEAPPVQFRRVQSQKPLPMPQRGGHVNLLREFVTVDDDRFALLLAFLTACYRVELPTPLLIESGEAGSGKSTTARVLKRVLDPTAGELRGEPKQVGDVMIAAKNGHLIAYDNLDHVSPWLSNVLCCLAAGGGTSTRELYTDDEEIIFEALRPVILTGIEDIATRGDLLDRAILLRLQPIPKENRVAEEVFWQRFHDAHPKILGAILDRVSGGLRELPSVKLDELPRMADFARWAVACERGADETPRFMAAYVENQCSAYEQALDGDSLAEAIVKFMANQATWTGTATELYKHLVGLLPEKKPTDFPKAANALSGKLKRLAPNLIHEPTDGVPSSNARSPFRLRTPR